GMLPRDRRRLQGFVAFAGRAVALRTESIELLAAGHGTSAGSVSAGDACEQEQNDRGESLHGKQTTRQADSGPRRHEDREAEGARPGEVPTEPSRKEAARAAPGRGGVGMRAPAQAGTMPPRHPA